MKKIVFSGFFILSVFCIALLFTFVVHYNNRHCGGEMLEAIVSNSATTLRSMLDSGKSPDCLGKDDDTLLGAAVHNRNIEMMKLLLKYKADVNQTDGGTSPLAMAALFDCVECADLLIASGGKFLADKDQIRYLRKFSHINNNPYWSSIVAQGEGEQ